MTKKMKIIIGVILIVILAGLLIIGGYVLIKPRISNKPPHISYQDVTYEKDSKVNSKDVLDDSIALVEDDTTNEDDITVHLLSENKKELSDKDNIDTSKTGDFSYYIQATDKYGAEIETPLELTIK